MTFEEQAKSEPGPGEVQVQSRVVGICGSDIHLYTGTHPYRTYPNVFGHEVSGWVTRVGQGVSGLSPGDHVVMEPLVWCGECYPCSIGRTNCCSRMRTIGVTEPGAMADFFNVPARCLHQAPKDLPAQVAALCEPYSIGFQATARGEVDARDHVVVLGAGPIGLTILAAAKQRGAQVAITDLIDRRLEIARKMAADLTINSGQSDPVAAVREWTGGSMASVVIEAVGHPKTIESAIELVADAGRVVIVGVTEQAASIRGVDMTKKELTIYGSRNNLGRFKEAVDYVSTQPDLAAAMVTHQFSFSQAIEAFETADAHPEQVCKVILDFEN
jgi:threonine dehydrogenase-like Zn-dependent dehydrogenase